MTMQLDKGIRGDHFLSLRPFQQTFHKSSPVADHVKRPLLPPVPEPLLQNRYGQQLSRRVLRDKVLKRTQNMSINSTCFLMTKALCSQKAFDRVRVCEECALHSSTSFGRSKATERRLSVPSFRYTAVERADVCPRTSPMLLRGTPARSKLTARAWRKAWGPFLLCGTIPAALRRTRIT